MSESKSPEPRTLLLIEKDAGLRDFWEHTLKAEGFEIVPAKDSEEAIAKAAQTRMDYVFLGSGLEGQAGVQTLLALRDHNRDLSVLSPADTRQVKKLLGSSDDDTRVRVDRIHLTLGSLEGQPPAVARAGSPEERLIGDSPAMKRLLDQLSGVLRTNTTILLLGETGTGKGMLARVIHVNSSRPRGPFVEVACTSLPENLLESELFGHEAGAFTDARTRKIGLVETAAGGTLFLDEIGDLPPALQGKLLRLVEERAFRRIGGTTDRKADVRIIAATHRDLTEKVRQGEFRSDLYYRLSVLPMTLPPLRERKEDIPLLARHFLRRFAGELGRPVREISPAAEERLLGHSWPGNVRELRNAIERAVLLCRSAAIEPEDLSGIGPAAASGAAGSTLEEMERRLIEEALRQAGGNQSQAARALGISRFALRSRMRRHGLGST